MQLKESRNVLDVLDDRPNEVIFDYREPCEVLDDRVNY